MTWLSAARPRLGALPSPAPTRRAQRRPAAPRPRVVDALTGAAGLGLGIVLALAITGESSATLRAPGGASIAAGRLTGLLSAYGMVVVVLLAARIPVLERSVGQDQLVRWHRRLGPWPLYLLLAHGVLITVGYAQLARTGPLQELIHLLWTFPGILAATVGSALFALAGIASWRKARARLAYETWWSVHLYLYLALGLSFAHQIQTGRSFAGHPVATAFWSALWAATLSAVLICRVGLPLWHSVRHRLRVVRVTPAGPGTVSVLLAGRALHRLPIAGGQFLQWRFLRRGLWWQAHPYSLSAAPDPSQLRITVKARGDHSRMVASLAPGTRVAIEGPYGVFTRDHATQPRYLLVGAGVGVTPVCALLQDLPPEADVAVVLRASREGALMLRDEIRQGVADRGGVLYELAGPRAALTLDAEALHRLVPDIAGRDVFVCGPDGFTRTLLTAARAAGVPNERIHHETFDF